MIWLVQSLVDFPSNFGMFEGSLLGMASQLAS